MAIILAPIILYAATKQVEKLLMPLRVGQLNVAANRTRIIYAWGAWPGVMVPGRE